MCNDKVNKYSQETFHTEICYKDGDYCIKIPCNCCHEIGITDGDEIYVVDAKEIVDLVREKMGKDK
ncbi:MAG TPA: hypothetical protein VHQ24_10965 [Lachnospiraceae bacterium]|jgi:hypothetical protein|nr:hypothetical protein [Lachnospiraceae bacterium]HEX3077372.1 hypothetical protein [Lachnospiraceae bacterium]